MVKTKLCSSSSFSLLPENILYCLLKTLALLFIARKYSLLPIEKCGDQALAGSRISIPGFFGTGFCQIPGSRDFSGWDCPIFMIPGFQGNLSGFFGIFNFVSFACQIGSFSSIFIITFVIIITLLLITIKSMSEII